MNPDLVEHTLISIKSAYGTGTSGILDDSAEWVLPEAIETAKRTWAKFKNDPHNHPEWGYDIPEKSPLRFKPSTVRDGVTVDVYCWLRWSDGTGVPSKQDIKMRIWSQEKAIIYRPDLDSKCVDVKLKDSTRKQPGRVISRFHFDRADLSQGKGNEYHPEFHMQIGGDSKDYELCWHPDTFDVPRIPHPPMELLLTCQLVAINFFPEKYDMIRREPHWRGRLREIQRCIMLDYYDECTRTICEGSSLLDMLRLGA